METKEFETIIKTLNRIEKEVKGVCRKVFDVSTLLTTDDALFSSYKPNLSRIQSEIDKINHDELYHILGMADLDDAQTLTLIGKIKQINNIKGNLTAALNILDNVAAIRSQVKDKIGEYNCEILGVKLSKPIERIK